MDKEFYPQGLKKNPIKVISPNGTVVMKFNSYREAIDVLDQQGWQHHKYAFSPDGAGSGYDKEIKKAEKQGYEEVTPQISAYGAKTMQGNQELEKRNQEWMEKTAQKKPSTANGVKKEDKYRRGMNIKK